MSATLKDFTWPNMIVLTVDAVKEVEKLRRELDGDIVLYGSSRLGRTLMEHDLADELHLMLYPVVIGAGEPFFGQTSDQRPMRLRSTQTVLPCSPTSAPAD